MTDDRLQQLKRTWEVGGADAARAAYLRECVRGGLLGSGRLELAAYCGHPAAAIACPGVEEGPVDPLQWVRGLEPWGPAATLRALVECVRLTVPVLESEAPALADMGRALEQLSDHLRANPVLATPPLKEHANWALKVRALSVESLSSSPEDKVKQIVLFTELQKRSRAWQSFRAFEVLCEILRTGAETPPGKLVELIARSAGATNAEALRRWTARKVAEWALEPAG